MTGETFPEQIRLSIEALPAMFARIAAEG